MQTHPAPAPAPAPAPDEGWFAYRAPRPAARARLFCLPHAGGGASLFRGWAGELGPDIDVWPVQLPGREARLREAPFTQLPALVTALADALSRHLEGPYALFGHSMGALLAFELARELRRRALPGPVHLYLASYTAPPLLERTAPGARTKQVDPQLTQRLSLERQVPADLGEELLRLVMPVLLADTAVCEGYSYEPEAPLDCALSLFRGSEDYVLEHHIEGWRELTRGPFSTRTFLGDHFFLRETPRGLLQYLRRTLTVSTHGSPTP